MAYPKPKELTQKPVERKPTAQDMYQRDPQAPVMGNPTNTASRASNANESPLNHAAGYSKPDSTDERGGDDEFNPVKDNPKMAEHFAA